MNKTGNKLSILNEFKFDVKPVGVKYLTKPPSGIAELNKDLTLCEMLKAAFDGNSFFASAKNHTCDAGLYVLGQRELEEPYINGEFGARMGVFQDERSAARLYHYLPRIPKGEVHHIALSPADQLSEDPDVLILLATTDQAEILLRAMSYKTGAPWHSRYSSAVGCAWLFIEPFLTGEINFITTGLGFGMRRRKLFPAGMQFIAIPFDKISQMLQTLREMPWIPRPYQADGPEYVRRLRTELGLEGSKDKDK